MSEFDWAEDLPEMCPPEKASPPNNEIYFRLVDSIPPTEQDFYSQRKLHPEKYFSKGECIARAVSLFSDLEECRKISKLPTQKLRNCNIVSIILPNGSGLILQTGFNKYHNSWWRTNNFDPVSNCQKVI
jgi:hypothetical protein